jgi:hypothetical protein
MSDVLISPQVPDQVPLQDQWCGYFLSYSEVSGSSATSATDSALATKLKGVHATLGGGGKRSIEKRDKNAETIKRTEFHPHPARSHILSS